MKIFGFGKSKRNSLAEKAVQVIEVKSSTSHVSYLFNQFGLGISNSFLSSRTAYNMYNGIAPLQSTVTKIANAIGGLPLVLRREDEPDEIIKDSEVLDILANPSTVSTGKQFLIDCAISVMTTRELWLVIRGMPNQAPLSTEFIHPYDVQTIMDTTSIWPIRIYTNVDGNRIWYDREEVDGRFRYLDRTKLNEIYPFISERTPTFRGISPLTAIKDELLGYSASIVGNTASIENASKPSGIISPKGPLTEKQWDDLQASMEDITGPENNGKVVLLPANVESAFPQWAPKDMDYATLQKNTVISVANLYSMPLPIILPDSQKFSNYSESQTAFYDEAVNEVTGILFDALKWILGTRIDMTGVILSYNQFEVPALRRRAIEQMEVQFKANALSTNEIRKSAGYEEIPDGNDIMVPGVLVPLSAAVVAPSFETPPVTPKPK